jgi:hypothetical protein
LILLTVGAVHSTDFAPVCTGFSRPVPQFSPRVAATGHAMQHALGEPPWWWSEAGHKVKAPLSATLQIASLQGHEDRHATQPSTKATPWAPAVDPKQTCTSPIDQPQSCHRRGDPLDLELCVATTRSLGDNAPLPSRSPL